MTTYDSPLRAIQESTLAAILAIDDVTSAIAVPPWRLFKPPPPVGEMIEVKPDSMPPSYPGAVLSLWEEHVVPDGEPQQQYGQIVVIYKVPVTVCFYATSDGSDLHEARFRALKIAQAAHITLPLFTPTGFPANSAAFGPLGPGSWWTIPMDPSRGGVMLDFTARYQVAASLPI